MKKLKVKKIDVGEVYKMTVFAIDAGTPLGRVKFRTKEKDYEIDVPRPNKNYKYGALLTRKETFEGMISKDGKIFEVAGIFVIDGEEFTLSEVLKMEVEEQQ